MDGALRVLLALDDAGQSRLRELNRRLAELSSAFERLNREARNAGAVAVDESELGEYLQVDKVLAAVYAAAEELYGLTFVLREDLDRKSVV